MIIFSNLHLWISIFTKFLRWLWLKEAWNSWHNWLCLLKFDFTFLWILYCFKMIPRFILNLNFFYNCFIIFFNKFFFIPLILLFNCFIFTFFVFLFCFFPEQLCNILFELLFLLFNFLLLFFFFLFHWRSFHLLYFRSALT